MFDDERLKPRIRKPRLPRMARAGAGMGQQTLAKIADNRMEERRVKARRPRDKTRIGLKRPTLRTVLWEKESEAHFLQRVIQAAHYLGWKLIYHTHDSRRSPSGFPDLVLVHERQRRLIFAELKTLHGRLTLAQERWRAGLLIVGGVLGVEYYCWRPSDNWLEVLRGP